MSPLRVEVISPALRFSRPTIARHRRRIVRFRGSFMLGVLSFKVDGRRPTVKDDWTRIGPFSRSPLAARSQDAHSTSARRRGYLPNDDCARRSRYRSNETIRSGTLDPHSPDHTSRREGSRARAARDAARAARSRDHGTRCSGRMRADRSNPECVIALRPRGRRRSRAGRTDTSESRPVTPTRRRPTRLEPPEPMPSPAPRPRGRRARG